MASKSLTIDFTHGYRLSCVSLLYLRICQLDIILFRVAPFSLADNTKLLANKNTAQFKVNNSDTSYIGQYILRIPGQLFQPHPGYLNDVPSFQFEI